MGSLSSAMIVEWWVDFAVRSLLVAAVAGLLLLVLRIRDANIQHRTWTLVLVAMMVLPALCSILPDVESPIWVPAIDSAEMDPATAQRQSYPVAEVIVSAEIPKSDALPPAARQLALVTPVEQAVSVPVVSEPIPWATLAVGVYVAVAIALLTRILMGIIVTLRMVRRGRRLTTADHAEFTAEVPIVESHEVRTPATVGIWCPAILLPSDWRTWNTETLQMAIAHESFHVRRRDALVAMVANVNVAVYWLNPLSWILRWRLADLAERVCDDEVLRTHGDHATYAETLLAMASRLTNGERVSPLVVPMARKAQVETRIEAIIDDNRPLCRRLGWRGAVVMLLIALPLIVVAAAVEQAQTAEVGDEQREPASDLVAEPAKEAMDAEDSWPDETAIFPSPYEGEVARRAWKVLRIKTVPATDAEQKAAKKHKLEIGVKIVDANVRAQLPQEFPLILLAVNKEEISSYKDLAGVLDKVDGQKGGSDNGYNEVRVVDRDFKVFVDYLVNESATIVPSSPGTAEQTTKDTNDTKEELTAEDPEAAKDAEKNDNDDVESRRYMIVYPLDENEADIKSWLKAIELASEVRLTTKDGKDAAVVIGTREEHERVSTLLQTKRAESKNSRFPTVEEQRAADLAYELLGLELEKLDLEELERVKAKGYKGGLRVAAISGRQTVHGDLGSDDLLVGLHVWPTESLEQVTEILTRYDMPELTPLKYYVIRKVYGGESQFSGDSMGKDEIITGRIAFDLDAWAEKERFKRERLKSMRELQPQGTPPTESPFAPRGEDLNKESPFDLGGEPNEEFLYDGKTFSEWRDLLHKELNPKKRAETLIALGAFGRAGKGQEAAQAILSVAEEFDWNPQGPDYGVQFFLGSTCQQQFISLPAEYTVPLILKAADDENPRLQNFAKCVAISLLRPGFGTKKPAEKFADDLKAKFPDIKPLENQFVPSNGRDEASGRDDVPSTSSEHAVRPD